MTDTRVSCWVCGASAAADDEFKPASLYRCPACGFFFSPTRSAEDLRVLYDSEYFEQYTRDESYQEDEAQRRYEALLRRDLVRRYRGRGRLLEIGSAAGYFLDTMRDAGFEVVGIEPARVVAEEAQARFGLDVRVGFVEDLQLGKAQFDVVCAWHVIEHLADPRPALDGIRETLQSGGYLLVEVPNVESVRARRRKGAWVPLDVEHHVGQYAPSTLRELLKRSGFEVLETETFPMLGYVRPARALKPKEIAVQVKELIDVRAMPRRPHPWKHELLRAVARTR